MVLVIIMLCPKGVQRCLQRPPSFVSCTFSFYSWNLWHPVAQSCFQPWKFLSGKELLKSLTLQYESVAMTSPMDICMPVQFTCSAVSNSLRPHEPHHARSPCPSPTPRVDPNPCPSSWWCHPTISSFAIPSPPALNLSQHQGLFQWVSSSHQVAKILEVQLQHQSFQWTPRTDLL